MNSLKDEQAHAGNRCFEPHFRHLRSQPQNISPEAGPIGVAFGYIPPVEGQDGHFGRWYKDVHGVRYYHMRFDNRSEEWLVMIDTQAQLDAHLSLVFKSAQLFIEREIVNRRQNEVDWVMN